MREGTASAELRTRPRLHTKAHTKAEHALCLTPPCSVHPSAFLSSSLSPCLSLSTSCRMGRHRWSSLSSAWPSAALPLVFSLCLSLYLPLSSLFCRLCRSMWTGIRKGARDDRRDPRDKPGHVT
jgi:hypothetical protein